MAGDGTDAAPDVSVIMPCRNALPFLPFAVDDLARSTGCRLEVLICDDGSSDGSREWLQELQEACSAVPEHSELGLDGPADCEGAAAAGQAQASETPAADGVTAGSAGDATGSRASLLPEDPITLHGEAGRNAAPPSTGRDFVQEQPWPGEDIASPPSTAAVARRLRRAGHVLRLLFAGGRGQGAAQNLCLEAASAPLVTLMDADDRGATDRIEKLLKALEAHRADGWEGVCSGVQIFGTVSAGMARYVDWQNSLLSPEDMLSNRFVEIPGLHQTGIYPVRVLRECLGGYRDLPSWPIDIDTWMRLAEAGVRVGKLPERLYGWRQHGLQSTRNHGRCGLEHLRRCKAHFLLRSLPQGVAEVEVWSVGQTLEAWGGALLDMLAARAREGRGAGEEGAAPPPRPAIRLVEWRPSRKRRRGGAKARGSEGGEGAAGALAEEAAAELARLERREAPAGEAPPPAPPGGEAVVRIFAFGNAEVREQAKQAITAADACGGEGASGRWARLDWAAA